METAAVEQGSGPVGLLLFIGVSGNWVPDPILMTRTLKFAGRRGLSQTAVAHTVPEAGAGQACGRRCTCVYVYVPEVRTLLREAALVVLFLARPEETCCGGRLRAVVRAQRHPGCVTLSKALTSITC